MSAETWLGLGGGGRGGIVFPSCLYNHNHNECKRMSTWFLDQGNPQVFYQLAVFANSDIIPHLCST